MTLSREIQITPAFDKKDPDPSKDYGIGASRIFFIVKGKHGAITVNFGTNWYPKSLVTKNSSLLSVDRYPLRGWSWDYHSKKRRYDGQAHNSNCEFIGQDCYCDGSCLRSEKYVDMLLTGGSEKVFEQLELDYEQEYGEQK